MAKTVAVVFVFLVAVLLYANRKINPLPIDTKVNSIVINKADRILILFEGNKPVKSYSISLGGNPVGNKVMEGDQKTPEGNYIVDYRNQESRFHLALHVSYPDSIAARRAKSIGVSPGGMIMIHGLRNGIGWIGRLHLLLDWTDGCIAVTNPEIEQIWSIIQDGTPVTINP